MTQIDPIKNHQKQKIGQIVLPLTFSIIIILGLFVWIIVIGQGGNQDNIKILASTATILIVIPFLFSSMILIAFLFGLVVLMNKGLSRLPIYLKEGEKHFYMVAVWIIRANQRAAQPFIQYKVNLVRIHTLIKKILFIK